MNRTTLARLSRNWIGLSGRFLTILASVGLTERAARGAATFDGSDREFARAVVSNLIGDAPAFLAYRAAKSDEERDAAAQELLPLAEEGNLNAILVVAGHLYISGDSKNDAMKAFELYALGAEQGDALCQLMTGYCYQFGLGTSSDLKEAERWYRKSADNGDSRALESCAFLLIETERLDEGFAMLAEASERGSMEAAVYLGDAFSGLSIGEENFQQAVSFYERGAQLGSGYAMRRLGDIYRQGAGQVKADPDAAYYRYAQATQMGEPSGYEAMGRMRLFGEYGRSNDWKKALELFERGGEANDVTSAYWLAFMYSSNDFPCHDAEKAYYWIRVCLALGIDKPAESLGSVSAELDANRRQDLDQEASRKASQMKALRPK